MLTQHRQPLTVGVRGRPDDVRRAPDQHRTGRDDGVWRDQRALAQNAPAAEARAWHEDRAVADLAQVTDRRPDDGGAVAEDGALAHPDRMGGGADHHPVLQDGRVVADAHRSAMRAHHQALRQDRAGTDVDLTEDHRGSGDLGLGLVNEKVVEAHAPSPSSQPFGHPADRYRLYARTIRARSLRSGDPGRGEVRRSG